jgi:hypothetical protein
MGMIKCVSIEPVRVEIEKDGATYEGYIHSSGVNVELATAAAAIVANNLRGEDLLLDNKGDLILSFQRNMFIGNTVRDLTALWFGLHPDKVLLSDLNHSFRTGSYPYVELRDIQRFYKDWGSS